MPLWESHTQDGPHKRNLSALLWPIWDESENQSWSATILVTSLMYPSPGVTWNPRRSFCLSLPPAPEPLPRVAYLGTEWPTSNPPHHKPQSSSTWLDSEIRQPVFKLHTGGPSAEWQSDCLNVDLDPTATGPTNHSHDTHHQFSDRHLKYAAPYHTLWDCGDSEDTIPEFEELVKELRLHLMLRQLPYS